MNHGGPRQGAGRPKGSGASHTLEASKAKEYLIQEVIKELEPMLRVQIEKAIQGDSVAFKQLMDRAFGRPTESIETKGRVTFIIDE